MKKPYFPTRAEEIGYNIFDYFAKPTESFYNRLLNRKATVLVGGRGTGKTMLLKSMAFDYKIISQSCEEIFKEDSYIGCYIRIDSYIVTSFKGRGISKEKWNNIFAHYFNLAVMLEIVNILKKIRSSSLKRIHLTDFISRYYDIIGENCPNKNLESVEDNLKLKLDELVRYINNPKNISCPTLISNGYLIFQLCKTLNKEKKLSNKTWFILLDEYENLNEKQQIIINTLIKANQPPVIFKIALRPGGWWTKETLSNTESLESIADYDMIDYQNDISDDDFRNLVIEVLKRNLILNGIEDSKYQDIRNLLPKLSPDEEARLIEENSNRNPNYKERIAKYIDDFIENKQERKRLKNNLIIENEPLKTRIHLVLLDRGIEPVKISKNKVNNTKKYENWYYHNRIGTLFLFCNEYSTKKMYSGFKTYLLLSSKIMRNFVNLFSRAWEFSIDEGFSPSNPKPFNYKIQSRAAYDVSQKKVFEISSYAPNGRSLYSFANYLGRIFEKLNKDQKQSQPERNHFAIKGNINKECLELLKNALLYSVIQEAPATKIRSDIEVRDKDYLFNRIYCPYYNMSYRKMHKLELKAQEFEILINGTEKLKKQIAKSIFNRLLKNIDTKPLQLSLMDSLWRD